VKFNLRNKSSTAFSFISLADVVLLLLIFFLLSSTFIVQPGIRVRLPKARTEERESERNILVSVTRDGDVYLGDENVDLDALPAKLYSLLLGDPEQLIVLRADKDVSLSRVVQILDMAKSAGGEKFLIATQPDIE
jgi:biopolymer transport protein ExbD